MRVLQVLPYFSPRMGGVARVVHDLATHLSRRGHDVTVVAGDYMQAGEIFPPGAFRQVLLPSVVSRWGFYFTPALVPWARKHVARFDLIHLHEVRTFQNAVTYRYALRYAVPYVLSAHGTLPLIVQRKLAKRLYDRLVGRSLLASASRLVAVSPAEAEQYRQAGVDEGRIRMVYNGLDLEEFADLPPQGRFRKAHGIADGVRIVLYLGRLHRRKGVDHLLRAFAQVHQELAPCRLVVAGPDDGEEARLQALAGELGLGDGVHFTGPLYTQDKLSAYVDASVLASPAAHEIFGLVPFEALMCGTPVIVCGDCGSGQLLGEAGAAHFVSYGDTPALADALRHVLDYGEEAHQRVIRGQRYVGQRLDWKIASQEMEQVYETIVRARLEKE